MVKFHICLFYFKNKHYFLALLGYSDVSNIPPILSSVKGHMSDTCHHRSSAALEKRGVIFYNTRRWSINYISILFLRIAIYVKDLLIVVNNFYIKVIY